MTAFIEGRKGHPSRFVWSSNQTEVATTRCSTHRGLPPEDLVTRAFAEDKNAFATDGVSRYQCCLYDLLSTGFQLRRIRLACNNCQNAPHHSSRHQRPGKR
jgi:hypothetical protein